MATIVTRSGKGSPLTNNEVDANFTNLNTDKAELSGADFTGNITFTDNAKATFGAGDDLQIYSDGSASLIKEDGSGNLKIYGSNVEILSSAGEDMIAANADSFVRLYYDNTLKLATTSTGIDVTGEITADGMTTSADINFGDNDKAVFGAGSDLQIYHDGSNSYIKDAGTGDLILRGSAGIKLQSGSGVLEYLSTDSATGTLTLASTNFTGDLDLGDNVKAKFGASDDLQIYHDGARSYISDQGAGGLRLLTNQFSVMSPDESENLFFSVQDGSTYLYHDGGYKLNTTSTGIDVTGEITADGLTVDGDSITVNNYLTAFTLSNNSNQFMDVAKSFSVNVDSDNNSTSESFNVTYDNRNKKALTVQEGGDISFYEDTGTTPKLFWDASAESLGIGTSSPSSFSSNANNLVVGSGSGTEGITINSGSANYGTIYFADGTSGSAAYAGNINYNHADNSMRLGTNGSTTDVVIDSSGRVGIGTSSPATTLEVKSNSTNDFITLQHTSGPKSYIGNSSVGSLVLSADEGNSGNTSRIEMKVDGSEAMRIDSSGRVGIGTSNVLTTLHTVTSTVSGTARDTNAVALFDAVEGRIQVRGDDTGSDGAVVGLSTGSHNWGLLATATGKSNNFVIGYQDTSTDGNVFGVDTLSNHFVITTSGDVGIGTSSPAQKLDVSGNIHFLGSVFGENGSGYWVSGDNTYGAGIFGDGSTGNVLRFQAGSSERARINSTGNLLVGKTSPTISTTGVELRPNGQVFATQSGNYPLLLNRTTSDGDIAQFRKDGTTVGSIGTVNGDMYLGTGDTGLFFSDGANYIMPYNVSTPGLADGLLDLGRDTNRFKDLYLSGNVYANALIHDGDSNTYVAFLPDRIYMDRGGNRAFDADSGSTRFGRPDGSEAARIDSSGNLLVGTTSAAVANGTTTGIALTSGNQLAIGANNDVTAYLNRISTNGTIAEFRKDGTAVGSIGTANNDLVIGTADTNLWFDDGANAFNPASSMTLGASDGVINLGTSGRRFKDLYLSGKISTNTATGLSITADSSNRGILNLSTSTAYQLIGGTYYGYTGYKTGGYHRWFGSDGSEDMRLDSSGNLLVGTTSSTLYSSTSETGTNITSQGGLYVAHNGTNVPNFNRITTDGDIVKFRKNGTTVGTIGTSGSALVLGNGDAGFYFNSSLSTVMPWNITNNTNSDAAIDIGHSANRFKDLYLSSGVYLGGTGAANKLDDYEEGTFTPSFNATTTSPTVTYNTQSAKYTKVGRLVTVTAFIITNTSSGGSGHLAVDGLPFAVASGSDSAATIGFNFNWVSGESPHYAIGQAGTTRILLYKDSTTNTISEPNDIKASGNTYLRLTMSYFAA